MARLKALHLLYSGSEKGGAQRVAFECSNYNDNLFTSTVKSGKMSLHFKNNFINFFKLIFNYKFDIIFCSDLRALLLSFICLRSFLSKRYVILHSDKLIQNKSLIIFLCKFFSIYCVCTTKAQFQTLNKHLKNIVLVRITDTFKMRLPKKKNDALLYFGRLEPVKNIDEIINIYSEVKKKNSRLKLTIVGSGSWIPTKKEGVNFIRQWKTKEDLINIMKKYSFVVNATNNEGFSLQIMEGVSAGLFPFVKSKGLIENYNLSERSHLNVKNIEYVLSMDNDDFHHEIKKIQQYLKIYLKNILHIKEFIRLEITNNYK